MADGIMHEDAIEDPAQAKRPHIALNVLTLRIEAAAQSQHGRREINQRAGQCRLEMGRVVTAAAAEIQ